MGHRKLARCHAQGLDGGFQHADLIRRRGRRRAAVISPRDGIKPRDETLETQEEVPLDQTPEDGDAERPDEDRQEEIDAAHGLCHRPVLEREGLKLADDAQSAAFGHSHKRVELFGRLCLGGKTGAVGLLHLLDQGKDPPVRDHGFLEGDDIRDQRGAKCRGAHLCQFVRYGADLAHQLQLGRIRLVEAKMRDIHRKPPQAADRRDQLRNREKLIDERAGEPVVRAVFRQAGQHAADIRLVGFQMPCHGFKTSGSGVDRLGKIDGFLKKAAPQRDVVAERVFKRIGVRDRQDRRSPVQGPKPRRQRVKRFHAGTNPDLIAQRRVARHQFRHLARDPDHTVGLQRQFQRAHLGFSEKMALGPE